ncbi:MAG: tyrosine-type recombinase/integrase [Candidatus Omnitrophota bacterium]
MRIYKRGKDWYVDYLYQGRRRRLKIGPNRKEAEAVLAKIRSQIIEGTYFDSKKTVRIKLAGMAERFMNNHSSINNKSSTVYRNASIINNLSRHLGNRYLFEIRDMDIDWYKKVRLEEGVKHTTINREIAVLRAVLNKAKAWGFLRSDVPKMALFKVDNTRVRYLEEAEAIRLIEACPEPLKSIVLVALNSGMRRGEILNLKWTDVNFPGRIITVRDTKSKKNRYLPMNQPVLDVLTAVRRVPGNEYVFIGDKPGTHLSEGYVSHRFEKVVDSVGINDFHFHDLRHSAASWLVMGGVDLRTVQSILGHQTYQMTLRYAHLSPEHQRQAVDILAGKTVKLKSEGSIGYGTNLAPEVKPKIAETVPMYAN